jgi:Protein of unknown function (DUF1217)
VNTTSTFLAISRNLSRYQQTVTDEPAIQNATAYYKANIGGVTSVDDLIGNYRLLSFALNAYGLSDQINSTALIKQVLKGGVDNPKSLANTLPDPRWKAFAAAFNFVDKDTASISTPSAVATTTTDYVEQKLEDEQGAQDPGVELALYFERVAPTVTSAYGILGDQNLLEVVQTIFGLPATASTADIDAEATSVSKLVPLSELKDPNQLQQLAERFTALYDLNYGPNSNASTTLKVAGDHSTITDAASTILGDVISSNGSVVSELVGTGSSPYFSNSLMESLQGLQLGGD